MPHIEDRCDVLDLLEEAATTKRALLVELEGGREFTDHVRDVVTEDGEDYAEFKTHGRIPVSDIRSAGRAEPFDPTYRGKPIRRHDQHERWASRLRPPKKQAPNQIRKTRTRARRDLRAPTSARPAE